MWKRQRYSTLILMLGPVTVSVFINDSECTLSKLMVDSRLRANS